MRDNVLVISLDIDGCVFRADANLFIEEDIVSYIIANNIPLIMRIHDEINRNKCIKVILNQHSLRQSVTNDLYNSLANCGDLRNLSAPVLFIFQSALQALFPDLEIVVDPFWMSDLYGEHPAGENLLKWLKFLTKYYYSHDDIRDNSFEDAEIYSRRTAENDSDKSKISHIYAYVNRAVLLNQNANITMLVFDDHVFPIRDQYVDGSSNLKLPQSIKCREFQYPSQEYSICEVASFQGTGLVDPDYWKTTRTIAQQQCDDSSSLTTVSTRVQTAQLRNAQEWYLSNQCYTTTNECVEQGILPEYFIVTKERLTQIVTRYIFETKLDQYQSDSLGMANLKQDISVMLEKMGISTETLDTIWPQITLRNHIISAINQYTEWMTTQVLTSTFSHIFHSKTGRSRAIALRNKIACNDGKFRDMNKCKLLIRTAISESSYHKHSLSRYLIWATQENETLDTYLGKSDEEFKEEKTNWLQNFPRS